jgi:hypothetical protein
MNNRRLENGSRESTDVLFANRAAGDPLGQRKASIWRKFMLCVSIALLSGNSLQTRQIKQSPEL